MDFVDANPFLRSIAGEDARMARQSREYFRRLERSAIAATTSEAIIAEVVYVLSSKVIYERPRSDIRNRLRAILQLRGWHLPDRSIWLRALDVYRDYPRLSFPDSLAVAHVEAKRLHAIISFDRDFGRVPGIVREEP